MRALEYRKIYQALNFFSIKESGKINKMKAIKLIWLSDRLHLRLFGRTVTGDLYYAMKHGPVPSNAKNFAEESGYAEPLEKKYGSKYIEKVNKNFYKSVKDVDEKVFSTSDIEIMTQIYKEFGIYDQYELVDISHNYPEWTRFEDALNKKIAARFPINVQDFFKNPESNDNSIFNQAEELLEVSKEDFSLIG